MGKQSNDIQEQLKQAILTCGMTPCALAKEAGINRSVLSFFLNGHRSIGLDTAAKLAKVLGLEFTKTSKVKG